MMSIKIIIQLILSLNLPVTDELNASGATPLPSRDASSIARVKRCRSHRILSSVIDKRLSVKMWHIINASKNCSF